MSNKTIIDISSLTVEKNRKEYYIDSRNLAKAIGKAHFNLIRDIKRYCNTLRKKSVDINIDVNEYFKESTYKDKIGRTLPCYKCTKLGCDMIANKLTSEKGIVFTALYVKAFYEREKREAERQTLEYQQLMFYDIPHQKEQMKKIDSGVKEKSPIKYIKANTIADKAVSKKFGYKKIIKKEDMTTEMIKEREKILEQVTSLMIAQSLGVEIPHISEVIYSNIKLLTP